MIPYLAGPHCTCNPFACYWDIESWPAEDGCLWCHLNVDRDDECPAAEEEW